MRLKILDVIEIAKKFIREQAEYSYFRVLEVKADEPNSRWIVIVDAGLFTIIKKEVTIDDRDGNVIGFK